MGQSTTTTSRGASYLKTLYDAVEEVFPCQVPGQKTLCHIVEEAAPEQFNWQSQLRVLTDQAPTNRSMLRLLGCLLEKPPWERPHGLSSLGVPACRKHCASPLHGYDSFITRGACLQASHVLPLSMGSFSIRERCNCKFILTPCTLKNIMPVGTGQPRLPTCGKILAEEISE